MTRLEFLHEELVDIDISGTTEDDWPEPSFGFNQYVYDCYYGSWKVQDATWVESDEKPHEPFDDEYDRMHIRLWYIYSPVYGFILVANVHLENGELYKLKHELLHIGKDYWYAYEYAEKYFLYEFNALKSGPWWVSWNPDNWGSPLIITQDEGEAKRHGDPITSYYVYLDFNWKSYGSIKSDYISE